MPPVWALDMAGFGHSEKPGLSYTQHLWEAQVTALAPEPDLPGPPRASAELQSSPFAQVADFALEVMGGRPVILAGNSIGGGIAAGVAGNLRSICRGVGLCNTAGNLVEPDEYEAPPSAAESVGGMTLQAESGPLPPYAPVPLVGQRGLELFGTAVIAAIFPSIPARLAQIYADRPQNACGKLERAISQGAANPGSANVIGSGQKLPPQRPLNEVLGAPYGFDGPVLVPQGRNDRVSGPARAVDRSKTLARLRDGVTVSLIDGGHCVQDDAPDRVAESIVSWLPSALGSAES